MREPAAFPPHSVLPFVDAASRQLDAGAPPAAEPEWRERVLDVIRAADGDPSGVRAAELLAAEPALLSVFFQNVDLLYERAYPGADIVSLAVMEAVWLLEEK